MTSVPKGPVILLLAVAGWAIFAGVFWIVVSAADAVSSYFARLP